MTSLYLTGTSNRLYHGNRAFRNAAAAPRALFRGRQQLVNAVQLVFRAEINLNDATGAPADDPDPRSEGETHPILSRASVDVRFFRLRGAGLRIRLRSPEFL